MRVTVNTVKCFIYYFLPFFQNATVMATQRSVALTWHYIWQQRTEAEAYVRNACTTLWDVTVKCVNLSITRILTGMSGTHKYVSVSWE